MKNILCSILSFAFPFKEEGEKLSLETQDEAGIISSYLPVVLLNRKKEEL